MRPTTLSELVKTAEERGISIGTLAREREAAESGNDCDALTSQMARNLQVMREAAACGLRGVESRSGLTGGDARRVAEARTGKRLIAGEPLDAAIARALAVSEVNAAMGRIVAAPTAGSCGVLPGVLLSVAERVGAGEAALVDALFTAGAVGAVIARSATLAGAEGGCQAECGSAAAMAAAAAVQLAGGSPAECAEAVAISMKGMLGLVCDPVAGLVEVPCIKRNALAAANAIAAADMALAGVKSVIPADEVIAAMGAVGRALPASLRETSQGGLAVTPTGRRLARQFAAGGKVAPTGGAISGGGGEEE
ncbi:MAG: L-serine ammonia-lyase, iron-sulfur-dependent, subunit alpha [Chloroflexota bacterium]